MGVFAHAIPPFPSRTLSRCSSPSSAPVIAVGVSVIWYPIERAPAVLGPATSEIMGSEMLLSAACYRAVKEAREQFGGALKFEDFLQSVQALVSLEVATARLYLAERSHPRTWDDATIWHFSWTPFKAVSP